MNAVPLYKTLAYSSPGATDPLGGRREPTSERFRPTETMTHSVCGRQQFSIERNVHRSRHCYRSPTKVNNGEDADPERQASVSGYVHY